MAYKNYTDLDIQVRDGIAVITFVRPTSQATKTEVHEIFRDLRYDPDVRVILMTGTGDFFLETTAAKQDRKVLESLSRPEVAVRGVEKVREFVQRMMDLDKPLIAAVNGRAYGSSLRLALFADFVIASEKATFCDPHVKTGMAAGDGGVMLWPLLTGMRQAQKYLLTGGDLDAKEAERIGLITQVVPHDQLLSTSMALARRLAANPALGTRLTKQALMQWYRVFAVNALEFSMWAQMTTMISEDGKEGLLAHAEGRPPVWRH